jgi:biotin carboxyl carrier protein
VPKKYFVVAQGREHIVTLSSGSDARANELSVTSDTGQLRVKRGAAGQHTAIIDGRVFRIERSKTSVHVTLRHRRFTVTVSDRPRVSVLPSRSDAASKHRVIKAPLPGQVVAVAVAVGEHVRVGQRLVVIEAMKMQNPIVAEREGVVAQVHVSVGATVQAGAKLVELDG